MDKKNILTLILGDTELECKGQEITIQELGIQHVGFILPDLDKYDLIVYSGRKGTKILKSRYFSRGTIV